MIKNSIKQYVIFLFCAGSLSAQTVNIGELSVASNTQLSTVSDFYNKSSGDFLNDGNFYVYGNFKNDGLVTYADVSDGKTFFIGKKEQLIEGVENSYFQNIEFDNKSMLVPFLLKNSIVVNNEASFKYGIIDVSSDNDVRMIFNEKAFHSGASNMSFVDGRVEKIGAEKFEFPIGDNGYFRPSYNDKSSNIKNVYNSEYFLENAGSLYPFANKDEDILEIDGTEYWNLTQNQGTEKTVLSLTLDTNTTPASFFIENPETELAIVRWDVNSSKWINEGGVTDNVSTTANYSKLVTSQISGYGIFTIGIVSKAAPAPPAPDPGLEIFNAVSVNGDGRNDSFLIKGIDKYPNNRVEIFNRWGVKVFDAKSYNESSVMFRGYSDGRSTVSPSNPLPTGTYFYILEYEYKTSEGNLESVKKAGYLYLNVEN